MKIKHPGRWIATLSLVVVLVAGIVDLRRAAPGPLSAAHERDPTLAGMQDCNACHGGLFTSLTDSCLECHDPIAEQIATAGGLHGSIEPAEANRCAVCHSEHHGSNFALVNAQSFARMGVPDPEQFDHVLVGFAMSGAHLDQDCTACHENARAQPLPPGGFRYLGLDQDCATCHEDPHEGRMQLSCTSCHGQESFELPESTGHERFLPLTGGHADVDCRTCHEQDSPRSMEALGEGIDRPRDRNCIACHESPHDPDFVTGNAALADVGPGVSCGVCHQSDHESFVDDALELTAAQHARSGFPLDQPHGGLDCEDCHGDGARAFAARFPGRAATTCDNCHADPHDGQFERGPFADGGCLACHDHRWFEPHAFGIEEHAQAFLPLEGTHAELQCEACHEQPTRNAARVFRGTPSSCEECHQDAHDGRFDALAAEMPRARQGLCSRCHEATTFDDVPEEAFDHEQWTGFPVLDAHAQASCEACHPHSDEPDVTGRTFGRVEDSFGDVSDCASCHRDPHAGRFDEPGLPRVVASAVSCERCHEQSSFRSFPEGFDHRLWTGFPLNGAHASTSCGDCHRPLRRPDHEGRTWDRAAGSACSDCHSDPHARQFTPSGESVASCVDCHRDGNSFGELRFSHERDSRFPLGEAHQGLECSACHEAEVDPLTGADFVRYRPLPTECVDCHGVHESVLLRRAGIRR